MKNWFKKISWKSGALIGLAVFVLVLLPTHFINADGIFGIGSIAGSAINDLVSWIFVTLRAIFQSITGGLINLLNYAVYARAYNNVPIVISMWKILRNLSNMFFVLALIYMAFATIFNISKFRFQDMIWRFLIVAVLINFSLSIGGLVIDGSQVLANVFLKSIGNPGTKLGSFLNPEALFKDAPTSGAIDFAGAAGVSLIMDVVLNLMFIFSLLVAVVFSFFRIIAIWGLLIVSPIAWMSYILPGTKQWWSKWWGWFFGWNLFLPVYLFIMYLGLVFLSQGQTVIQQVTGSGDTALFGTGSITVNLVFFYVFAAFFIAFGTTMAAKMTTSMGGSGFEKGLDWARTAVGKFTTYDARRKAISGAIESRVNQFQQEGFQNPLLNKIYGGKEGDKRMQDRYEKFLGVHGADVKVDKGFTTQAGRFFEDYEKAYKHGELSVAQISDLAKKYKATDPRGFAYRKLAAQVGQLDNGMFVSTLTDLQGNRTAVEEFIKAAKESKFSKMKGGDLAKMATASSGVDPKTGVPFDYTALQKNVAARREMYRYVQSDAKATAGMSEDQLRVGLELFGGHTTAEGKAFLKEVGKIRPEFVTNYNLSHPDTNKDAIDGYERQYHSLPTNDFQLKVQMYGGALKSGDVKQTAGIKGDVWNIPEFKEALKVYVSQIRTDKARKQYVTRLEKALLDSEGGNDKIDILYRDILGATYTSGGIPVLTTPPTGPTPPI